LLSPTRGKAGESHEACTTGAGRRSTTRSSRPSSHDESHRPWRVAGGPRPATIAGGLKPVGRNVAGASMGIESGAGATLLVMLTIGGGSDARTMPLPTPNRLVAPASPKAFAVTAG
jgi:hypothetical protein